MARRAVGPQAQAPQGVTKKPRANGARGGVVLLGSTLSVREHKAKSQGSEKATGKLLPFDFRDRLFELTGAELSVWLAYFLHSNLEDIAWPGRVKLQEETWRNEDVITQVRARLVARGWLIPVGNKQPRKPGNRFAAPAYKVVIPPRSDVTPERKKRAHHGKFRPRSDVKPPHRLDVRSAHRSDVTPEGSNTGSNKRSNTSALSVAQLGAAPCGSLGKKKEKPSLQEGNGFPFNGRFLKITPEMERQIEQFIPSRFERTAQFSALEESLREAPIDPVAAVQAWVKNQQGAKLRDALREKGWIR